MGPSCCVRGWGTPWAAANILGFTWLRGLHMDSALIGTGKVGTGGSTEGCSEKQVEALAWDWTDAAGSEGHGAPSGGLQLG